jgi:hypothetical protein
LQKKSLGSSKNNQKKNNFGVVICPRNTQFMMKFRIVFLFVTILALHLTLTGCVKEEPAQLEIAVGEVYEGGIVAHIFQPGEPFYVLGETHGIIVAPTDQVFESQWGCQGNRVTGTSSELGRGRENTKKVVEWHDALPDYYNNPTQCHPANDGTVAAKLAIEFRAATGQQDWFMPSLDEMNYLYDNRDKIGGFSVEEYWSSCETNATAACVMSFVTGEQTSRNKSEYHRVRLIRFF